MTEILFHGSSDHHITSDFNLGSAAVMQCTSETLRTFLPGAKISSLIQLSPAFASRNDIHVLKATIFSNRVFSVGESIRASLALLRAGLWASLHKYLYFRWNFLINSGLAKAYYNADVIVDLSMDHLNDIMGIIPVLEHTRDILIGIVLGKPLVIYAQSIGPYRGKFAAWVAGLALNRVSLIMVREEISLKTLQRIKVTRPAIHLTADPAFLLRPVSPEQAGQFLSGLGVDHTRPVIGIAIPEGELLGAQQWRGLKKYIRSAFHVFRFLLPEGLFRGILNLLKKGGYYAAWRTAAQDRTISDFAAIADHLAWEMNAVVLLIPHVLQTFDNGNREADARQNVRAVQDSTTQRDKIITLNNNFTADEIKGIIGSLDMLISAKMHAAIAAISQCVPTLAIGTHPKFSGIMKTAGLEKWVCDKPAPATIIDRARTLWAQREQVRRELSEKIPVIIEQSLRNGELVRELLNSRQKPK
jgi:colanic acid/amylovoran biosynthesis protein